MNNKINKDDYDNKHHYYIDKMLLPESIFIGYCVLWLLSTMVSSFLLTVSVVSSPLLIIGAVFGFVSIVMGIFLICYLLVIAIELTLWINDLEK